jgi:hypothetical protein
MPRRNLARRALAALAAGVLATGVLVAATHAQTLEAAAPTEGPVLTPVPEPVVPPAPPDSVFTPEAAAPTDPASTPVPPPASPPAAVDEPPAATKPPAPPTRVVRVVQVRPLDGPLPAESEAQDGPPHGTVAERARFATRNGASGGLSLVDPSSGEPGSVRIQLTLDSFPEDDFLHEGEGVGQGRQALAAGFTPARYVELYGALLGSGTSSEDSALGSLHSQGAVLGAKTWTKALAPVHLGGDIRFELHNELGGQLPALKATSVGMRFASALDLREAADLPLRIRGNLEYLLDNSALAAEDVEQARYRELSTPDNRFDETRHLLSRFERYALGVSRVDTLSIGLGAEAMLELGSEASLHPMLEWRVGLPVNRRGFNCALPPDDDAGTAQNEADSCASDAGFAAWPSVLSAGVRVVPPLRGLTLGLGAEIGTSGTTDFVHELSPVSPLVVMFSIGYTDDARD